MDPVVKHEAQRAKKYVIVRVVSRVGDLGIYIGMLAMMGLEFLVVAFALSSMFNFVVDFWGQKLWTFESDNKTIATLMREFLFYLLVRGGNILAILGFWYVLQEVFSVPPITSTILVIFVFWPLSFILYRWLFTGSIKDLPELMRKLAGSTLYKKS